MRLYMMIFLFLLSNFAMAQSEYQQDFQKIKSRYNYTVFRPSVVDFNYFVDYTGDDLDQIFHIAVSIQNDFLQFNKESSRFYSQFEISLIIRQGEETRFSKSWQKDAELFDFEMTNSKRDYQYQSFVVNFKEAGAENLQTGEYEILLEIQDKFSSRVYKNKRKLEYSDWDDNQNIKYSEVAFSKSANDNSLNIYNITATRNVIDINQPYYAFASLFASPNQEIDANIRLYKMDKEEKNLFSQDFFESQSDEKGKCFVNYYLPYKTMGEGKYSIRFSVSVGDSIYEIERDFSILWFLKPLYLYKVDLAVRPLKYLLNPQDMEKVGNLEMRELEKWFNGFWKERDPDTLTIFNELQDVYYKRVTETVRSFSTRFHEGWQTDRGMIFLLYGEPSEVENAISSLPHIVWKYNYEDNVRQFKFVDKTKTGNFVLVENGNE